MFQAILGALQAIPKVVDLFQQLIGQVGVWIEAYQEKQRQDWLDKGMEIQHELQQAKTDDERKAILLKLQSLRGNVPK